MSNEVDNLFKKIKEIQDACRHMFYFLNGYKEKETLQKGVFRVERGVTACCLDCSKKIEFDVTKMCPYCFGGMVRQKAGSDRSSIDELYSCKACKFTVRQ